MAPSQPDQVEAADLQELISRLELIDVHELARLTTEWSERLGAATSRRSLLLKLSAGLSLAAASPALADDNADTDSARLAVVSDDGFSGIWHSRYVYPSTGRDNDFTGEHYIVIRQHGGVERRQGNRGHDMTQVADDRVVGGRILAQHA